MQIKKVGDERKIEPIHPATPQKKTADQGDEEKKRAEQLLPTTLPLQKRKKPPKPPEPKEKPQGGIDADGHIDYQA